MKRVNVIITVIGLALFAFMAARIGWTGMAQQLKAVWTTLPILIALGALRLVLQTMAWSKALRAQDINVSTGELLGARLASRAVAYLAVLGPAVSEPMKISLLPVRSEAAAAATLVETSVYWFGSGLFTICGCLCAARLLGGRGHLLPVLLMASLTIGVLALIARSKPLLSAVTCRLGSRCPSWLKRGEEVEIAMREFKAQHPAAIGRMFWLGLACQTLLASELVVIFWSLKIPLHLLMVLGLETASRIIKIVGGLVPARIGADEGGMAAAFLAFGLPSASGLALAIARRSRDLVEVAAGLCWLAWKTRVRTNKTAGRALTMESAAA